MPYKMDFIASGKMMTEIDTSMIHGNIIWTHHIGLNNTKESRISAVCRSGLSTYCQTLSYDPSISFEDNHTAAAEAVVAEMEDDLSYEGCEPLRIVCRGCAGRGDRGFYFLISRGGAK